MRTVTLSVDTRDVFSARVVAAMKGESQGARVTFASIDLLLETLTPGRWAIMKLMTAAGPQSLHELARRADRNVRAIRQDVQALLNVGILERQADGTVVFPYDNMHVDFMLI
ncbi:Predicted transcriptional regulator [Paraburkholderia fungorum]|uniref:Predicted transcriptional regulator n=1 Tax=Paraburkholderia fungorum TaxID=134537 RepID=A0A1H0Z6L7_9BURK|nr:transcriptional regulator [Paraburkholderia fungorum]SDQ22746.1 Predicted transcriptional regulator [Paraburkholderia fungorum]